MTTALRTVIGGLAGVAIGLAMWRFVGCRTGACPLTANPYVAAILWGVMGALVAAGK